MSLCIHCPEGHRVVIHPSRLGGAVLCPRCLIPFLAQEGLDAARNARSEKGKARPSRDEDDDDEEKPKKKIKPQPSKKKDDENEKPRAKKAARKKEEDEDEEEEDEEEEEEEEPIEWTPRKKQLNACSHGLTVIVVAHWLLAAFAFMAWDAMGIFIFFESAYWAGFVFQWFAVPFVYLTTGCLMAGLFINLAVPAKAEGKGALIAGLVFGGLVFLLLLFIILTLCGALVEDALRLDRLLKLLIGASILAFAICYLAVMSFESKLLTFMRLHLESTLPLSNGIFIILCFLGMLAVSSLDGMLRGSLGDWVKYVVLAVDCCGYYAIFLIVTQVNLIRKLRKTIATYIRDE